jgi:integrase
MHDLRRYFAAAGIEAGLSLEQVGQLLGHTQAQTTRRYAWLLTGAATAAAEVVASQIKRRPNSEQ